MSRYRTFPLLTVGALTLALPALTLAGTGQGMKGSEAATPAMHESSARSMTGEYTPTLQKINTLIGENLENTKNQSLGRIEDVVLNSNRDRVAYFIVSHGGVLGIGAKYTAVPWSFVALKNTGKTCVLNMSKERFDQAPAFTGGHWPDMSNPQWSHAVYQFFTESGTMEKAAAHGQGEHAMHEGAGTHQWAAAGESRHFWGVRHSKLIGMEVKNGKGQDLGDIEDIVIDANKGNVAYGIVSFGGVLGVGEKYAAVPWSAMELRPAQRICHLNTDKKTLESIAFKPSEWPNLANPSYARNIYARFDREPYWEVFGYVGGAKMEHSEAAWLPGSAYSMCFNPSSVEKIEGTVESVGTFQPERGALDGLRLRVKTKEGNVVTVYAGPERYVSKEGWTFHHGDMVTVNGSKTTVNDRSVIMACEIQREGKTLELRNKQGEPKWTAEDLRAR
jgi:sporulation protein YlmC with PRC-barrel domain